MKTSQKILSFRKGLHVVSLAQILSEYIPISMPGKWFQSALDCKENFHLYELYYFIIWTLSPNHHLSEHSASKPGYMSSAHWTQLQESEMSLTRNLCSEKLAEHQQLHLESISFYSSTCRMLFQWQCNTFNLTLLRRRIGTKDTASEFFFFFYASFSCGITHSEKGSALQEDAQSNTLKLRKGSHTYL